MQDVRHVNNDVSISTCACMHCCNIHSKLLGSHYLLEAAAGDVNINMFGTTLLDVYRGYGHVIASMQGNPGRPPEAKSGFDQDRIRVA